MKKQYEVKQDGIRQDVYLVCRNQKCKYSCIRSFGIATCNLKSICIDDSGKCVSFEESSTRVKEE